MAAGQGARRDQLEVGVGAAQVGTQVRSGSSHCGSERMTSAKVGPQIITS